MHTRETLLTELEQYRQDYPAESATVGQFITFVRENENCFERELLIGHITGSAWVVNTAGTHALFTHHRKLEKWLQLGGHADGDPDVLAVAIREVKEESGLDATPLSTVIFDLDAHPIPARKDVPAHIHYDIRYLLQTTGNEAYTVSDESFDLKWIPLEEIIQFTQGEDTHRMATKWLERLAIDRS